ncbi:MAG: hypothetical protein ACLQUT_09430 [Thermoleophilia bacterium]
MTAVMRSVVTSRYRLPVSAMSLEDDLRIRNDDLPAMTASELWAEDVRVSAALAQVTGERSTGRGVLSVVHAGVQRFDGREWLQRRLRAVNAERRRREGHRHG